MWFSVVGQTLFDPYPSTRKLRFSILYPEFIQVPRGRGRGVVGQNSLKDKYFDSLKDQYFAISGPWGSGRKKIERQTVAEF